MSSTEPTKFCLTSEEELTDDQTFPIITAVLIIFNIIGIIGVSLLIFFETRTKLKYHRVKETPPKLVLTREYLEKLRPPKKVAPTVDPNTIPSIPSIPSDTAAGGTGKTGETKDSTQKTNLNDPSVGQQTKEKTKVDDKKK